MIYIKKFPQKQNKKKTRSQTHTHTHTYMATKLKSKGQWPINKNTFNLKGDQENLKAALSIIASS